MSNTTVDTTNVLFYIKLSFLSTRKLSSLKTELLSDFFSTPFSPLLSPPSFLVHSG